MTETQSAQTLKLLKMRSAKVPSEVLEREFAKRDAEVLAKSARNFVPLAALGVIVSEILPFFHDGFPSTPLVSSGVVAMLIGLFILARSEPTRGRMVIATSTAAILASAYVGFACSQSGGFASPHLIALMVIFAFVSGLLTLTVFETTCTLISCLAALLGAIVWLTPELSGIPDEASVALMYVVLLALVAVVTNRAGRFVRRRAFERSLEIEALHRFAVEEVLCRHLSPQFVEYALSGESLLDSPAERRVVTMLFADVVGFSRMVETLTLEELEALMTRFYDTIAAITFRYDATLDKFIGDAVMALVGAPLSQTPSHQASIALTMAADWHHAIESLGLEYLGKPLKLRIGIHQGEVAVGAFGGEHRLDYTVLGSAVNIAARLEKLAPAGSTALSQIVKSQSGLSDQAFDSLGLQSLKGVASPVEVWVHKSSSDVSVSTKTG